MSASSRHLLDFEKPIYELELRLDEMRQLASQGLDIDLSTEINALEGRVNELRETVYRNLTRWQRVQIARHPLRPYTQDYIGALTTDFVELHGDRAYGDDPAIIGGFARFKGSSFGFKDQAVMILGHQKGRDMKERKQRRFGMPNPEGYRKALRLFRLAAKFNRPIITLLDTPGAFPGMDAEERGQAEAIARNLFEMAQLPVPVVVVVIGEGASGGALGIGVGNRILMMENAWYSVISPESCSSILWRSWDHKEDAARALKLSAADLAGLKLIDEIIPEPIGGAHRDPDAAFQNVGTAIARALVDLADLSPEGLVDHRIDKFDRMGAFQESRASLNHH